MINLPERTTNRSQQSDQTIPQLNGGGETGGHNAPQKLYEQHWWCRVVGLPENHVKIRVRGNHLYVLCEAIQSPDQKILRARVIRALLKADPEKLVVDHPDIYQITLYGKQIAESKPAWARVIYFNQLQAYAKQHAPQLEASDKSQSQRQATQHQATQHQATQHQATQHQATYDSVPLTGSKLQSDNTDGPTTAVLAVSNRHLAQQGEPEAIARHLSEFLSQQGIAVRAGMKALIHNGQELALRRLVLFCEAAYSPDPALLIEPIAKRLRALQLTTFRDAVVYGQVQGEASPDWKLRIDLTPPQEMLREWARWGDLDAILQLLNHQLQPHQLQVSGIVLDMILYLTCWRTQRSGHANFDAPPQQLLVREVAALLEQVAPQGIHAVCLYGAIEAFSRPSPQALFPEKTSWQNRLTLAAASQVGLAESTEQLATRGDIHAITFLLNRLLNPELAQKLATGGLRVQAGHRHDLIHVMVDGATLPSQKTIVPLVADYVQSLQVSGVNGLRVYGRRAGEKHPRWQEAVDFVSRDRLVPEASPEFAASEAYVGDLITQQTGALLVRPDLNADEMRKLLSDWTARLRQLLVNSQIFAPLAASRSVQQSTGLDKAWFQDAKVAAVWGSMGILMALCADWGLGIVIPPKQNSTMPTKQTPQELSLSGLSLNKSGKPPTTPDNQGFNDHGFTGKEKKVTANQAGNASFAQDDRIIGSNGKPLIAAPIQPRAIINPEFQTNAAFNTPQLNDKVALYEQFVAQSGVPDILIVGSSRAMRGIDPVALQDSLAAQGYSGRKIFNFGVNGATAQVVDLIVRRLIPKDKLPKLIIWADGARALNSGRVDLTYNAIVASPGYAQLPGEQDQQKKASLELPDLGNSSSLLAARYQAWNSQLNGIVARQSAVYEQRSSLVEVLRDRTVAKLFPKPAIFDSEQLANLLGEADLNAIDVNGFLALSVRFNPTTYFQKYARVSGANDADYKAFQLQGRQTDALKSAAEYVKAQGSSLVFVNLPMTAEYLDSDRRTHEDSFQQFMIQSSATYGFTYRNLADSLKTNVDNFSDPSHLNRYGAHAVSQQLAQDALIPWGAQ